MCNLCYHSALFYFLLSEGSVPSVEESFIILHFIPAAILGLPNRTSTPVVGMLSNSNACYNSRLVALINEVSRVLTSVEICPANVLKNQEPLHLALDMLM